MDEYISRENVLKAFNLIAKNPNKDYQRGMQDTIDCLVPEVIADIPSADVQPVKRGRWITKAGDYYKKWQNSGRSWDDMPYFITGEHIACSECFTEYDVCTEGIEHWIGCPCCLARMNGGEEDENSN